MPRNSLRELHFVQLRLNYDNQEARKAEKGAPASRTTLWQVDLDFLEVKLLGYAPRNFHEHSERSASDAQAGLLLFGR